MSKNGNGRSPWNDSPALIFWELTRACDLKCRHCRAEAKPRRDPGEIPTEEIARTLRSIGEETSCVVVFTGGDPFKHPGLPELITTCDEAGLKPALTPSTTPLLTNDRMSDLKRRGLKMLALSLDGPDASSHDHFRGENHSFDHTMRGVKIAEELGIPLQINTTVSRETRDTIPEIGDRIRDWNVFRWALFFLVRTGHGSQLESITPGETESLFQYLYDWSSETGIKVKTTNAPHYRRWNIQHQDTPARPGIIDGDGIMFISHRGVVYPSGFLPVPCGNIRDQHPIEIYREHPLLRSIRERNVSGKCGECEFVRACGGSRANAMAEQGDPLAHDPRCQYVPNGWNEDPNTENLARPGERTRGDS